MSSIYLFTEQAQIMRWAAIAKIVSGLAGFLLATVPQNVQGAEISLYVNDCPTAAGCKDIGLFVDGKLANAINGVPVDIRFDSQGPYFAVRGNLLLHANDTLVSLLSDSFARVVVGNDLVVENGARIDAGFHNLSGGVSHTFFTGLGGAGGDGGSGAAPMGTTWPLAGGGGWGGGTYGGELCELIGVCDSGTWGADGANGGTGDLGEDGQSGNNGGSGIGWNGGGGLGGAGGIGGIATSPPLSVGAGGDGGAGSVQLGFPLIGGAGGTGGGGDEGGSGSPGVQGGPGGAGTGGRNVGSEFMITPGAGGGSGGQGGGGSGGTGGGGGGGGGGGSGGGAWTGTVIECLFADCEGGIGGHGGTGGDGGKGGTGGVGGAGGSGGAGGGALQFTVFGRASIGGELVARGQDGAAGAAGGDPLNDQTTGVDGTPGVNGAAPAPGGDGGRGGDGGKGGDGTLGRAGGNGGPGGGGAGGGFGFFASQFVSDATAVIDTRGGSLGTDRAGGDGRLVIRTNSVIPGTSNDTLFQGNLLGVQPGTTGSGVVHANPFVFGEPETPYIPDLVGGAEAFGILQGNLLAGFIDMIRDAAPAGASAAGMLMDIGPAGFDDSIPGYDMLLYINLSNEAALPFPRFGVGQPFYSSGLLTGGFGHDLLFGGNGLYEVLHSLGSEEIFATLVPEGISHFNFGAADSETIYVHSLAYSRPLFFTVPEPATFGMFLAGAIFLLRRVRSSRIFLN